MAAQVALASKVSSGAKPTVVSTSQIQLRGEGTIMSIGETVSDTTVSDGQEESM